MVIGVEEVGFRVEGGGEDRRAGYSGCVHRLNGLLHRLQGEGGERFGEDARGAVLVFVASSSGRGKGRLVSSQAFSLIHPLETNKTKSKLLPQGRLTLHS